MEISKNAPDFRLSHARMQDGSYGFDLELVDGIARSPRASLAARGGLVVFRLKHKAGLGACTTRWRNFPATESFPTLKAGLIAKLSLPDNEIGKDLETVRQAVIAAGFHVERTYAATIPTTEVQVSVGYLNVFGDDTDTELNAKEFAKFKNSEQMSIDGVIYSTTFPEKIDGCTPVLVPDDIIWQEITMRDSQQKKEPAKAP